MILDFLTQTGHRPYPLPGTPYVMYQTWYNLLFAHWEVDEKQLRALVPASLPLDLFEGTHAYLAVVPFGMCGIRPRYLPAVPYLSKFLELNVRTYVTVDGRPGVFFFSLDAANLVGTFLGREWYNLAYQHARMSMRAAAAPGHIQYTSARTGCCRAGRRLRSFRRSTDRPARNT